ncbi:MAG: ABC transporter ATP-binding protein [Spirochaetaceae bacterium]|nr:MAG: ABC transporter ATP-binding protein [Spirochaetaceae bacterium]
MTENLIETRSVGFVTAEKRIIDGISISVKRGEFVGLVGPNGAGKTTLLRLMIGVLPPTAGEVLLEERRLQEIRLRERARKMSYLSQETSTVFPYPVLDILLMGRYPFLGRFRRESESDLDKARRALAYVGMSDFEDRYFNELSGGERQLILFAKILVQETDLLLLDEPTSNLDIKHQDQFFSMACELTREKKAVVAAVHNLNIASQYCSRLILLHRGRVAAEGKPDEVLRSEQLDGVYETKTVVTRNTSTGALVVNVAPRAQAGRYPMPRIHVIGGAGSAINLTRELVRLGYRISGGVAHEYDADQKLWHTLEVPFVSIGAFSHITAQDLDKARSLVEEADLTILCSFPVGPGNEGNLALAERARRLVILEAGPQEEPRIFFSQNAQAVFYSLLEKAEHMDYWQLCEALESGTIFSSSGEQRGGYKNQKGTP